MKVVFLSGFKTIPANTQVQVNDEGTLSLNGVTLGDAEISALASLGIVRVDEDVCDCTEAFAPNYNSTEWSKILQAIIDDKDAYAYGDEYEFYSVEDEEFKPSTLKRTASHIGRIPTGFSVPAGSTAKKKFNRLEKLNVVYGLGLTRQDVRSITGYTGGSR